METDAELRICGVTVPVDGRVELEYDRVTGKWMLSGWLREKGILDVMVLTERANLHRHVLWTADYRPSWIEWQAGRGCKLVLFRNGNMRLEGTANMLLDDGPIKVLGGAGGRIRSGPPRRPVWARQEIADQDAKVYRPSAGLG